MRYAIYKDQLEAAKERGDLPAMVYWTIKIQELADVWNS